MDTTADETMLDKRSEAFRHQCEVRWLLRKADRAKDKKAATYDYIGLVRAARGDDAADKLLRDTREQWAKGNRGDGWK
jgi:hypothetical protein